MHNAEQRLQLVESCRHALMMKPPLVQATLRRVKTQTRRLMNPQPCVPKGFMLDGETVSLTGDRGLDFFDDEGNRHTWSHRPRMQPGDLAYIKDRVSVVGVTPKYLRLMYDDFGTMTHVKLPLSILPTRAHEWLATGKWRTNIWQNKMFLPRWLCRYVVAIDEVWAEPLHEITHGEALAEGVDIGAPWNDYGTGSVAVDQFAALWDSIADKGARWADNPWVLKYTFKLVAGV